MKRCIYVSLPEGWGWLPIEDFPEEQRGALGDGEDVDEEEIYRSEPSQAKDGDDRDLLASPGLLLSSRKIVPDVIKHFLAAYASIGQNLVKNAVLGVHERGGDRRECVHTDMTPEEQTLLYQEEAE